MAPGDGKAGVKKGGSRGKGKKKGDAKKGADKEVRAMMYGHGDVEPNYLRSDTVDLVEDIAVDYCSSLMRKAMDQGAMRGAKGLNFEDILFVLRKDERKFERGKELLAKNEEIKQARKTIEGEDGVPKGL